MCAGHTHYHHFTVYAGVETYPYFTCTLLIKQTDFRFATARAVPCRAVLRYVGPFRTACHRCKAARPGLSLRPEDSRQQQRQPQQSAQSGRGRGFGPGAQRGAPLLSKRTRHAYNSAGLDPGGSGGNTNSTGGAGGMGILPAPAALNSVHGAGVRRTGTGDKRDRDSTSNNHSRSDWRDRDRDGARAGEEVPAEPSGGLLLAGGGDDDRRGHDKEQADADRGRRGMVNER